MTPEPPNTAPPSSLEKRDGAFLFSLQQKLSHHWQKIDQLSRDLRLLPPREGQNPSVFQRFLHMFDCLIDVKKQEEKTLRTIEAIEEEHRRNRAQQALKKADEENVPPLMSAQKLDTHQPEPTRKTGLDWFNTFMVWHFFFRNTPKHTPDQSK